MSLKEMIRSLKMISYKNKNRKSIRKNRKSIRKNRKSIRKNRKSRSVSKSYKKYDGVINVDTNYTPFAFGCRVPKSFI
jgi:hypothetical protein